MGKAKKTRKFAVAKKIISPKDSRIKSNQQKQQQELTKKEAEQNACMRFLKAEGLIE